MVATTPPGAATSNPVAGTPSAVPTVATPIDTAGWKRYSSSESNRGGPFSFLHPPDWTVQGADATAPGRGLSVVLWSWTEGTPPPASVKIDLLIEPSPFSSCERQDDATAITLAGLEGWGFTYVPDSSTQPQLSGVERVHVVAADTKEFRYCFVAYELQGFDDQGFARITESFQLVP